MRILLVEDNPSLADWTAKALRHSGLVVDCVDDGLDADHLLTTQEYDVVLLDLTLPRMDGLTVLRKLRARGSRAAVLVLTVKGHIEDRVQGLDAGADDYLSKPYALSELEARIRALGRRSHAAVRTETTIGALTYESNGRTFTLVGAPLDLTPRERAVLEMLVARSGMPVSKETLCDRIVGLDSAVSVEAIEVYIHRLRRKLEGSGVEIRTLRGLGYLLGRALRSLRGQLAFWLLAPLLGVWAVNAWLSYRAALEAANRAHDRTLLASVRAIAERIWVEEGNIRVDIPYSSLEMLESSLRSRVYYRVSRVGARGTTITGYEGLGQPAGRLDVGKPYFYDSEYLGEHVRVAALAKQLYDENMRDPVLVQVAETGELRDSMSWQIASAAAARELLLIVLATLLLWWALNRGLRPLYALRNDISRRSPSDLSRMSAGSVPSELQPLIHAINEHTAQAARMSSAQKQFVADAAHQLKTPLSVMRAQADFVSKQSDLAGAEEALADMRATTERVSHLVDQLLSLNRAEAAAPVLQALDLDALARETTFEWLPVALAKSIDLGFEGGAPAQIRGHRILLHELLGNLLDNAIRFTPDGGRITVRVRTSDASAILSVEDSGPGIPAAERERIFDRFYQIPGRDSAGCGLGLAITREIATLHGATVAVSDAAAGGTEFIVTIPLVV